MSDPYDAIGADSAGEPEFSIDPETRLTVMRMTRGRTITSEEVYRLQEEEGLADALKWMSRRND